MFGRLEGVASALGTGIGVVEGGTVMGDTGCSFGMATRRDRDDADDGGVVTSGGRMIRGPCLNLNSFEECLCQGYRAQRG